MQGRIGMGLALMIEAGALATATSALGFTAWHLLFKPLTMAIAIIYVANHAYPMSATGRFGLNRSCWLLLGALLGSLAGDVFLMLSEHLFIPGLVSFLLAHLCYIALFKQGVGWFGHRGALGGTLALGLGMYAFLWQGGLPAALRVPVAVYVVVIALMAAQAWGRHAALRERSSLAVALGACCFMLSDSLLATTRFVQPLPLSQLWVLATYYAAQVLIVSGMVTALTRGAAHQADARPQPLTPHAA